jgi:hypothetical protein
VTDRWVDISEYQPPGAMRWVDWRFPRGQYRLTIGNRLDMSAFAHRMAMRGAGMLTGPYGVPHEVGNQADQAWRFCDQVAADDENDDWCDAERPGLTEPMLRAWCDSYDRHGRGRLAIYTGYPWWVSHVPPAARARYAGYKLILAAYPFDPPAGQPVPMDPISRALRSTPPANRRPVIPPPWTVEDGWQHTGKGSLPGYVGFLDLGIYRVAPSAPAPDPLAADLSASADAILRQVAALRARLGAA